VKALLPATAALTVPAKPGIALTAAATPLLLYVAPPAPIRPDEAPPSCTRNAWVAGLNPVRVTCCCSLPPCSTAAIPAAVLFWPRTTGAVGLPDQESR
jgi:ABC-type sulfate transport system permease component